LFDTIGINTVAVIQNSEQGFNIFDALSSDLHRMPNLFGKCTLLTIEGIEKPCIIFANTLLINRGFSFEVKGVFVRDNELVLQNVHESPKKIKYLPFSNKRNQTQPIKRKRKSLIEL